jgi:hypothetical protein
LEKATSLDFTKMATLARSLTIDWLVRISMVFFFKFMSRTNANPMQLAVVLFHENDLSNKATIAQLKCLATSMPVLATVSCVSNSMKDNDATSTSNGF